MTAIAWSKVRAVKKGTGMTLDGRITEGIAVILCDGVWTETDMPYEEAAANLREIEAMRTRATIEASKAQPPTNKDIYDKANAATGGELERLRSWAETAVKERDAARAELNVVRGARDEARKELNVARGASEQYTAKRLAEARSEYCVAIGKMREERDAWQQSAEEWRQRYVNEVAEVAAIKTDLGPVQRDRDELRAELDEARIQIAVTRVDRNKGYFFTRADLNWLSAHTKHESDKTDGAVRCTTAYCAKCRIVKAIKALDSVDAGVEANQADLQQELDEVRADNETLVNQISVTEALLRAERATKLTNLRESYSEQDLLDLLKKFADGTGGRRTGELIRRGLITVLVTDKGHRVLNNWEDIGPITIPDSGTVTCKKCGFSQTIKTGDEIAPCHCWKSLMEEQAGIVRANQTNENGVWDPDGDELSRHLLILRIAESKGRVTSQDAKDGGSMKKPPLFTLGDIIALSEEGYLWCEAGRPRVGYVITDAGREYLRRHEEIGK